MAFSRINLKKRYTTRKHGPMSRKRMFNKYSMKNFMRHRAKGFYLRPPSFLPIPPPQPPSLPIPPPQPPSLPKLPASNLPIPPPPKPLFSPPSPNQFIIRTRSRSRSRSRSPLTVPKSKEKKSKEKKQEKKQEKEQEAKPYIEHEPTIPQVRRSLRQVIINSDHNKKIKRRY